MLHHTSYVVAVSIETPIALYSKAPVVADKFNVPSIGGEVNFSQKLRDNVAGYRKSSKLLTAVWKFTAGEQGYGNQSERRIVTSVI